VNENSAQFTGEPGHTYAFYSTAVDNVGNVEPAHASPDTVTFISALPIIAQVPDLSVAAGATVAITNIVSNLPTQRITFALGPGAPAGATITTNGVFNWMPTCAQGSTTNPITIWATYMGTPSTSNSMTFKITVGDCVQVGLGSASVLTGQNACVPVNLLSTVGLTNITFVLAYPSNRFGNWTFSAINPAIGTSTVQVLEPGQVQIRVSTKPGQILQGPTSIGTACFSALPGRSAFLQVQIAGVVGSKGDGRAVGNASGGSARLVVVGAEPLLEAFLSTNGGRLLTLYGKPGASYMILSTTNLAATNWPTSWRVALSGMAQTFAADPSPPALFYNAYEFTADPPQIEARLNNGARSLLAYGVPGASYVVQYATNLAGTVAWNPMTTYTLTNSFQLISNITNSHPVVFYRISKL
jgi:hypothetical protein